MREISNLDLKIQLTNEYLRTGGVEKIYDEQLLRELIAVQFDKNGKAIPETISTGVNAFMIALLAANTIPPICTETFISEYTSFLQKSSLFDQTQINTEDEVDELFEKYKSSTKILFRGQRESKWRLYSSLQRFWIWDEMAKAGENYLSFLKSIIEAGKKNYEQTIVEILQEINIDSLNDIAVLGFLQHHNCPTPLLDWTFSFDTAMFFGIDQVEESESVREIDNYFSVYFIGESHFVAGGMRTLLTTSLESVGQLLKNGLIEKIAEDESERQRIKEHFEERSFFKKERIKGSGLIDHMTTIDRMINIPISYFSDNDIESGIAFSITNSNNIKSQNGVFTWNSHQFKPLEVIGNEEYDKGKLESEPVDYRFCECYNINKALIEYIQSKLSSRKITPKAIYPDIAINAKEVYASSKIKQ